MPVFLAACGGAEPSPFAAGSPASPGAPSGHRGPVAVVLDAEHPAEAGASPLLSTPTAVPAAATGHEHHHHHHHHGGQAPGAAP